MKQLDFERRLGAADLARCSGGAAVVIALAFAAACSSAPKTRGQPAIPVKVATVSRIDAPITVTASGVVDPMQTVAVQAQVSGALLSVSFREGDYVRAGQILFRIDPRPLQAAVDQARANLSRDQAQAEAARRDDIRYQTLVKEDYVTREQADQIHATAVAQTATVTADQAALRAAEVSLGYSTIRASISGRTGSLLVRPGNIVGPSSGPLVVINQIQPILVRFPVLSQDLPLLQGAVASHPLPVVATKSDSGNVTETGELSFLDNNVDSLTGTVTGKAVVQNQSSRFWPGQLVFLTVDVGVQHGVLAVPSPAVLTGQQGSYVYVVDPRKLTVKSTSIVAGRTVGQLTLVDSGLVQGQEVVIDGQARLNPGSKVAIAGAGRDTTQGQTLPGALGDASGGGSNGGAPGSEVSGAGASDAGTSGRGARAGGGGGTAAPGTAAGTVTGARGGAGAPSPSVGGARGSVAAPASAAASGSPVQAPPNNAAALRAPAARTAPTSATTRPPTGGGGGGTGHSRS